MSSDSHHHARLTPPSATRVTADPVALIDAPPPSPRGRLLHADIGVRIDREGVWYYHGSVIQRKELMCLFASTLTRDAQGGYWLVTPTEMGRIDVEDVPFLAVESFMAGEGPNRNISFRTNVDEIVTADKSNPVYVVTNARTGEPAPYVCLPRGREARITRAVFYDLVAHGEKRASADGREFGIWSRGTFFVLGDPGADA